MLGEFGVVCNFNWVFRQGLTEKLTFDQTFEGGEGAKLCRYSGKEHSTQREQSVKRLRQECACLGLGTVRRPA